MGLEGPMCLTLVLSSGCRKGKKVIGITEEGDCSEYGAVKTMRAGM
jgi:hypothetical protein